MPSVIDTISGEIRERCGSRSRQLVVWKQVCAILNLSTVEMISVGMIKNACPGLKYDAILNAMQYFCGPQIRAFEHIVALDISGDLVPLPSGDVIQLIERRSTVGLINPDTGEALAEEVPVVSYFRPSKEVRKALSDENKAGRG